MELYSARAMCLVSRQSISNVGTLVSEMRVFCLDMVGLLARGSSPGPVMETRAHFKGQRFAHSE